MANNNLRIIPTNVADTATITASSTSGSLVAVNLQKDSKTEVWRSTDLSPSLTLTWATAQNIDGVFLPFTNLTSQATIRCRCYTNTVDISPVFDSGVTLACAPSGLGDFVFGTELGHNAYQFGGVADFPFGGGSYAKLWLSAGQSCKKIIIDISDPLNTYGYIECSRIVTGFYWAPDNNADYGASVTPVDQSKQFRNDASDLLHDTGIKTRKLTINLNLMPKKDRASLWTILRNNGLTRPILFSLFPEDADAEKEQSHMFYGKMVTTPATSIPSWERYASQLDFEEL